MCICVSVSYTLGSKWPAWLAKATKAAARASAGKVAGAPVSIGVVTTGTPMPRSSSTSPNGGLSQGASLRRLLSSTRTIECDLPMQSCSHDGPGQVARRRALFSFDSHQQFAQSSCHCRLSDTLRSRHDTGAALQHLVSYIC